MSDALISWRRVIEAQVRERKLTLARLRQAVSRAEQLESLLKDERERRDAAERERRGRGELPTFAQERMNALLERAIERAAEKVAAAKAAESSAVDSLREAWQSATAIDRLLARREERAQLEVRRIEQKELDEIASHGRLRDPALAGSEDGR
jgi:flagellar biosynthesis chaperone FliJ